MKEIEIFIIILLVLSLVRIILEDLVYSDIEILINSIDDVCYTDFVGFRVDV